MYEERFQRRLSDCHPPREGTDSQGPGACALLPFLAYFIHILRLWNMTCGCGWRRIVHNPMGMVKPDLGISDPDLRYLSERPLIFIFIISVSQLGENPRGKWQGTY